MDALEFVNAKKFILESQIDAETLERRVQEYPVEKPPYFWVDRCFLNRTTLENFLKILYRDDYKALKLEESISKRMLNGLVDFNHFIRLNRRNPLSANDFDVNKDSERFNSRGILNLGLKRGAAFYAPVNHSGINLMIPVCLKGK